MNMMLFRCGKRLVLDLPKAATYLNTRLVQTNNMSKIEKGHTVGSGEIDHRDHLTSLKEEETNISELNRVTKNFDAELGNFSKYDISKETVKKLKDANINHLFAVQYDTFNDIKEGRDVIVQAQTGTGKTLAFALPILENLHEKDDEVYIKTGRSPIALTLTPTKERAIQIYEEFKKFKPQKVMVSCFHGGSPYYKQAADVDNGIDILIGTPGRILDHMEQNKLVCSNLKHVILDEADHMMDMGFQKDIDQILSNVYTKENKPQTLLFSATFPPWAKHIARKYTSTANMKQFDFIGTSVKNAVSVEHKAIKCSFWERAAIINDIMQVYSGHDGKTMVITSTKQEANELASNSVINMDSRVLKEEQRKRVLDRFQNGKFNCLIVSDPASGGLELTEIDLIIHTEPPYDVYSYLQNAGQTGRAGRNGVSIIFYRQGQEDSIRTVERKAGISFTQIRAAQQDKVIRSLADDAIRSLDNVKSELIEQFIPTAKYLIENRGAENAMAAALAFICRRTEMTSCSLITSKIGYKTYLCNQDWNLQDKKRIRRILEQHFDKRLMKSICNMRMCKDRKGCVFDVPTDKIQLIEEKWKGDENATLEQLKELPELLYRGVSPKPGGQGSSHDTLNNHGGGGNGPHFRHNTDSNQWKDKNRNNYFNNMNRKLNSRSNKLNNSNSNINSNHDNFNQHEDYSQNTTCNNEGTKHTLY